MRRSLWAATSKVAITGALIAWLVWAADWPTIYDNLRSANLGLLAIAAVTHMLALALQNVRWWLLLHVLNSGVTFRNTFASFYLGLFSNNFMPSSVGGDLVRILHMRTEDLSGKTLLASVVVDRLMGFIGVLLMGICAFWVLRPHYLPSWAAWFMLMLLVAVVCALAVLFLPMVDRLLVSFAHRVKRFTVLVELIETVRGIRAYRGAWVTKLLALGLTLTLQMLVALSYYLIGVALGETLALPVYCLVVPAVFLAASLPISLGGLGVREGAFVGIMVLAGGDEQRAIGISILFLFILLVLTLPGGLILPAWRRRRAVNP